MKAGVKARQERATRSPTQQFVLLQLPFVILALGVLFTLALQILIQSGVFYSGDAGLKALLAQQLASGSLQFNLDLSAPAWAKSLWDQGLYPFTPPYVYAQNDQHFITFPFTFPLITAPFYALLGYRGLYVIPIIALWILWFKVYTLCKKLQVSNSIASVALLILIFASPLSFYSGMYWEHTLAVTLAFCGFADWLFPANRLSARSTIRSGILIGLSVWFRPEFLCLVGAIFISMIIASFKRFKLPELMLRQSIVFMSSLVLTIALFFALNQAIYHHPLGIHALQVVESVSLREKLPLIAENFRQLGSSLIQYFPILFLPVLFLPLSVIYSKVKLTDKMRLMYFIGLLFIVLVPLIVPEGAGGKQWGPRFLLFIVPLASLLTALELEMIAKARNRLLKLASWGIACLLIAVSLQINAYGGSVNLQQTYQAIAPTVQALRADPHPVIGMSHQFIAQVFAAPVPEKVFFLTETTDALKQLAAAMVKQGDQEFLYLCYPHRPCVALEENPQGFDFSTEDRSYKLEFSDLRFAGKYSAYQVSMSPSVAE
jgi:hypothetical protein